MRIESIELQSNFYMTQMTQFNLCENETLSYGEAAFNCLLVVTKGNIKCSFIDDFILIKGDSILLSCEHSLRLVSTDKNSQGYILEFQEIASSLLSSKLSDLITYHGQTIRLRPFSNQAMSLEKLFQNLKQTTIESQLANQIKFSQMLQSIIEAYKFNRQLGDTILNVKYTISYIRQYYMHKISIAQLAEQANVSNRQYLRIFKKLTGKNPIDYINQYRIYRAQEQLLQTMDTVHKIATNVGVEDVNYFNRLFKQTVGCAPKEYISLRQKNSKIVTIHYVGELLELGVKPIADINSSISQLPLSITNIVSVGDEICNVNKLEALNPDIVIASDTITDGVREQIEQFVPVIVIPWDIDPNDRLLRIAKVIGKSEQARDSIVEFENERKRVKQLCKEQRTITQSATILRLDEQKVWIHATRFFPIFYEVLGFSPSELMLRTTERYEEQRRVEVPFEHISEIEADRIYIVLGREKKFNHWLKQLMALKDWNNLSAVRNNQVFVLRQRGLANSIYALKRQLEEVKKIKSNQVSKMEEGVFFGSLVELIRGDFKL